MIGKDIMISAHTVIMYHLYCQGMVIERIYVIEGQFGMTYLASSTTLSSFKTQHINNSM